MAHILTIYDRKNGHTIQINNKLSGIRVFVDGNEVASSKGLFSTSASGELNGYRVDVTLHTGFEMPHITIIANNELLFTS